MTSKSPQLRQWAIWPPALALLAGMGLLLWLLGALGAILWLQVGYMLLMLAVLWWLLPRFAYKLWCEGDALYWRWGQLHQGPLHSLPLAEIASIDVGELPDRPTRPSRQHDGMALHGGNFTPALNQGVRVATHDGRVFWFCLPEPQKFADALRTRLPQAPEQP